MRLSGALIARGALTTHVYLSCSLRLSMVSASIRSEMSRSFSSIVGSAIVCLRKS